MKTKSKVLLLALCAVLLVAASVLGTMAYLTSNDTVTNTFTVGEVSLGDGDQQKGLDEAKVDEYGKPIDGAARVQANTYKLLPGHNYTKDPTVHVDNDSEASYIYVTVENGIADIEALTVEGGYQRIVDQIEANKWSELDGYTGVYYKEWTAEENATAAYDDLIVFGKFEIADNVDADALAKYADAKIVINAYAVQQDGFDSAAAAWAATFGA